MTKNDRLIAYEAFFHKINAHVLTLNHDKIRDAVTLIDSWSYAHRCGNGELSDYQQQKQIDHVVQRMKEFK